MSNEMIHMAERYIENSDYVIIDNERLFTFAEEICRGTYGNFPLKEDILSVNFSTKQVQYLFLGNSINYCFFYQYPNKYRHAGYKSSEAMWEGLRRSGLIDRRLNDVKITVAEVKRYWGNIPLPEDRANCLNDAIQGLERYDYQVLNLLEEARYKTDSIMRLIQTSFHYWDDRTDELIFNKRLQSFLFMLEKLGIKLEKDDNHFSILADYNLPRLFRWAGILHYSQILADGVDTLKEIKSRSQEELSIRAATLVVGDRLLQFVRRTHPYCTIMQLDAFLWDLSRSRKMLQPYHICKSIWY